MNKFLRLLILMLLLPHAAQASPLLADLSNYRIDMDSSFNGTRMFIFGTRNDHGDVVVVVRGPLRDYVIRKKEEVGGIWINSDRMRLWNIPDFYAVATSKPLTEIQQQGLFRQLGIGEKELMPTPTDETHKAKTEEFSAAFLRHQQERRLYTSENLPLQFMGETLFKTTVEFPDNIPPGNYTAEIYLLSDGNIVGMQSTPITVVKTGFDAFLYNYAHNSPALYGITAILMALSAGWIAARLFEKT